MMGSPCFQNILVAAIVILCAASPGLNVNHAQFRSATLAPGAAQRGLGNSDDPILVTFREIADLRAEFQFVMKQFLYIALGGNMESSEFTSMTAEFEARLDQVKTGDASKNIIAPPDDGIQACVDELVSGTASLIPILTSNLGGSISESTLESIDSDYSHLEQKFSQVFRKYEGYGEAQGAAVPLIQNYAYGLQTYSEQLVVQSFFLMLNVNSSHYYKQLSDYERRFQTTVERITWGHTITEIPDLTNVCMLQAMLKVREAWYLMELQLQDVRAATGSFPEVLRASEDLRTKSKALTSQIAQPSCEASDEFDEAAWKSGISACNLFRELAARTSRLYVEVKGTSLFAASQAAELRLSKSLSESTVAIARCYKGSHLDQVPVPPSQELVDILKTVYDTWDILRSDLEIMMLADSEFPEIESVSNRTWNIDEQMAKVGRLYVRAARSADSASRAAVWQSVKQNKALLETMAKEALVISSADTAVGQTRHFFAAALAFEQTHSELLRGTSSSFAVPEAPLMRTRDACTLTTMASVLVDYQALRSILIQMYGSKDYLNSHKGFIAAEASNSVLVDAFYAFKRGWDEFRPSDELRMRDLQIAYIFANSNALGSKDNLDYAPGAEFYHQAHKQFHPTYRAILYERNYYDIFIFDLQGNLIYSVYKELDYATNFLADGVGQWKDSGLGEAFRAAVANPSVINVIDWKPYGPSNGALASFLSTGITNDKDELLGVFCTQMPPESKPVEISEMEPVLEKALETMGTAVDFYMQGHGTCSTVLDEKSWEIMLEAFNSVDYLFYQAQMEFALVTHGYSQTWLNNSAMGLEEHKGFLVIEAGKMALSDALWAFKQAWDAYRETNAERLLSLQIAYILLNPFPTGEKDKLDRATGPETYHTVHAQYHPIYREILYDRNYYDIFFFDTEGNLIYSVYKELDYATNFLADGNGEWKDSGLGEAYRAAMANPDGYNFIDWKPYGPSYGALASFLSTGVRRMGQVIGVFCTQLPPEFTPRDSSERLAKATKAVDQILEDYKFGGLPAHAPPSQSMSWKLFNLSDTWTPLQQDLSGGATTPEVLLRVVGSSADFASCSLELATAAADLAYQQVPTLPGSKMQLAATNLALLQKMQRNLVLIFVGGYDNFRSGLLTDITLFEQNQVLLRDGSSRRLAQSDIPRTETFEGLELLQSMDSAWVSLKPIIETMATGAEVTEDLKSIVELADDAVEAMHSVHSYFSTTTRTTTMLVLELLAPMPLTGDWAAGPTLRMASRLAEGIINQDQLLLPGYQLQHVVINDKCDENVASDIVVSAMAENPSYIGIGGMGCDRVCRPIASLATSLRLPFLSYECPSPEFSDAVTFPGLSRMGTVTELGMLQTLRDLKEQNAWSTIFLVVGDPPFYQVKSEKYQQEFQDMGFDVKTFAVYDSRWKDIEGVMASIKSQTVGSDRVVFLMGSESFYRKLVCASITQGLHKGIVWISEGSWRKGWWQLTDIQTSAHRQWLREDVGGLQLKAAFTGFKAAWDSFRPSLAAGREELIRLYVTDQKDELEYAEGDEKYHEIHAKYHPIYRQKLYDRGYYDIFFFDLQGDLIYSVFKETDYGTNFATVGDGGNWSTWSDSGLGQAFRAAEANPDEISYIDWQPYGPSAYADAAFFSTGLRDEDGVLMGIYAIQLPPEYERSIEETVEQCSFERISEAVEGAINVVGLGRPTEENMEKPLPCFKGYSPRSLLSLLDLRFETGYPVGDLSSQVEDPYFEVKAHAVDGACAFAFGIQNLLRQGHTVEQIQRRDSEVYEKWKQFFRRELNFQGASGWVKFDGNDRKNLLLVQQTQDGQAVEVGLVSENGTLTWTGNGTTTRFWQVEPREAIEVLWILYPVALTLALCCPCLCGLYIGFRVRQSAARSDAAR